MSNTITIQFTKEQFEEWMSHPIDDDVWERMTTFTWMDVSELEEGYDNALYELEEERLIEEGE